MSAPKKAPKTYVVSFRTTHRVIEAINQRLAAQPVMECKNHKVFARKLLIDFANGKLVHPDPKDYKLNPATNHAGD